MSLANIIDEPTLGAGATAAGTFNVQGSSFVVIAHIDDATAVGNLGAVTVRPYARDNATLLPTVLTPTVTDGPDYAAGVASQVDVYDITGIHRVQVSVTNAAGSARDVQADIGFRG